MAGLNLSPLRGLMNFWYALGYNLYIPSGLNILTNKINLVEIGSDIHFQDDTKDPN
ncbi:MAG: hypothetical protein RLZZ546_414 [Bacteroidota bacterium]|jgi:hypothetical protein